MPAPPDGENHQPDEQYQRREKGRFLGRRPILLFHPTQQQEENGRSSGRRPFQCQHHPQPRKRQNRMDLAATKTSVMKKEANEPTKRRPKAPHRSRSCPPHAPQGRAENPLGTRREPVDRQAPPHAVRTGARAEAQTTRAPTRRHVQDDQTTQRKKCVNHQRTYVTYRYACREERTASEEGAKRARGTFEKRWLEVHRV